MIASDNTGQSGRALLRCGRARANITPPVGLYLIGFGRPGPSQGIHDELYAKIAVISNAGVEIAIVTTDLLGLDFDVVKVIREDAERELGIPAENIALCSSHTHSGPATIAIRGEGDRDEGYIKSIERKILDALHEAARNKRESTVRFGEGRSDIGINRRERAPGGEIVLGRNPLGVMDPTVSVMAIESEGSRTMLFNCACHPVVLGSSNLLYSADFPGYAMRTVEEAWGGTMAMFVQGCCGNINSKIVGGTFEDAERLGGALGAEVVRASEHAEMEKEPRLGSSSKRIELPLGELPSEEVIDAERVKYLNDVSSAKQRGDWGAVQDLQGLVGWADAAAELIRRRDVNLRREVELQVLRIGGVAIATLPGEPFIEMALEIRARSKFKHTIVAGYSNGCIGYIPTPEAIEQGGYEADMAYKYYGVYPLAPSAFETIVDAFAQLCDEALSDRAHKA